jgi:hypothetical protein
MFFWAGLGFWTLAFWHLLAHAVFRCYQFLAAPSLMHKIAGSPARPVPAIAARQPVLYLAALQRLWLEPFGDWLLVKPLQRLSADLLRFELQIVDKLTGLPCSGAGKSVIRASGVAGWLLQAFSNLSNGFEQYLLLQRGGQGFVIATRRWGILLKNVEALLSQPRFLTIFIIVTLLAAF